MDKILAPNTETIILLGMLACILETNDHGIDSVSQLTLSLGAFNHNHNNHNDTKKSLWDCHCCCRFMCFDMILKDGGPKTCTQFSQSRIPKSADYYCNTRTRFKFDNIERDLNLSNQWLILAIAKLRIDYDVELYPSLYIAKACLMWC